MAVSQEAEMESHGLDVTAARDVCARIPDVPLARDRLQDRRNEIERWLLETAPECFSEQRHLDTDSTERVYWNYGYLMALKDVLALLGASTPAN